MFHIHFIGKWSTTRNKISRSHFILQAGMFNFRPSVRPVPLEVHISGYPGKHYCPRMATMNKPTFAAIRTHSPTKPVLVFVSSRRQTRLTALELISFLAAEDDPKQWLHMPEAEVRSKSRSSLMRYFVTASNKLKDLVKKML